MIKNEVIIKVRGGDGGRGAVHFRREKYKPKGGPDGGDGGRGGDVFIVGNGRLTGLTHLRPNEVYKADDGRDASGDRDGGRGRDLFIAVPLGTAVYSVNGELLGEILEDGQEILVARGGRGGLGNRHFATSTDRSPSKSTPGERGEIKTLKLVWSPLVDVMIVGPPNTGKTTLLNSLTGSRAKVGPWPFTTTQPNTSTLKTMTKTLKFMDVTGQFKPSFIKRVELILLVLSDPSTQLKGWEWLLEDERTVVVLNGVSLEPSGWSDYNTFCVDLNTGEGLADLMDYITRRLGV